MSQWKDPIVEEVRRVRKEIEKDFDKDQVAYHRDVEAFAKKRGFKFSSRKGTTVGDTKPKKSAAK